MTPTEAVDKVLKGGVDLDLTSLFEAVATTATQNETRRCVARVKDRCSIPRYYTASVMGIGEDLADDLLTTGGLKVDG